MCGELEGEHVGVVQGQVALALVVQVTQDAAQHHTQRILPSIAHTHIQPGEMSDTMVTVSEKWR